MQLFSCSENFVEWSILTALSQSVMGFIYEFLPKVLALFKFPFLSCFNLSLASAFSSI